MSTATHEYQRTVRDLMALRGITSINALAERAGVAYSTVKSAADGGIFANNESSTEAIAHALGVKPSDIRWPKTPSTLGKPAGLGSTAKSAIKSKTCPLCQIQVPSGTGVCDEHGIAGR